MNQKERAALLQISNCLYQASGLYPFNPCDIEAIVKGLKNSVSAARDLSCAIDALCQGDLELCKEEIDIARKTLYPTREGQANDR